jgi:hypothetical protein
VVNVRRKLIALGAGLVLSVLAFGAGGTSTATPASAGGPVPAQGMPTTTTTGY